MSDTPPSHRQPPALPAHVVEMQKAVFSTLTLVNGGAIVAILTFVGNLLTDSAGLRLPINLSWMLGALGCFAFGAGLSVTATIAGLIMAHGWSGSLPADQSVLEYAIRGYVALIAASGACFFAGSIAAFISLVFV